MNVYTENKGNSSRFYSWYLYKPAICQSSVHIKLSYRLHKCFSLHDVKSTPDAYETPDDISECYKLVCVYTNLTMGHNPKHHI